MDWDAPPSAPFLDPALETRFAYDALGRIVMATTPATVSSAARRPAAAALHLRSLYRLISATGREAKPLVLGRAIPESRDWFGYGSGNLGTVNQDNTPAVTALYKEIYAYGAAGNMTSLSHGTSWTRWFGMDCYRPRDWAALWPGKRYATTEWTSPSRNRLTNFGPASDAGTTHT